jgi:hypothetical protein
MVVARNRCLWLLHSQNMGTPSKQITAVNSGGTAVAAMYDVPLSTYCHSQLSAAKGAHKVVPVHVMKAYRGS